MLKLGKILCNSEILDFKVPDDDLPFKAVVVTGEVSLLLVVKVLSVVD